MHNGNQAGLKDDSRAWGKLALVAAGIGGASAGHYLTPPELLLWHNIFQRLYYLPIIYGAISFGMAGGLGAAAASAVCYIPHIVLTWHGWRYYSANQYAEIVVFFLVAAVTGILADQSRRRERELRAVYRELENSFEQLKRAERLSAVGQLSAGLAHEIRNPLASIERRGGGDFGAAGPQPAKARRVPGHHPQGMPAGEPAADRVAGFRAPAAAGAAYGGRGAAAR